MLADGEVFEGEAVGAVPPDGVATGELVFNTVLSGYQEVVTDPSYAGQVIAFTYPHIGNYGVTAHDDEAARPWCRGVVVRDLPAAAVVVARHGLVRGLPASAHGCPASRASTPAGSPGTCATTAPWGAPSAPRPSRSLRAAAGGGARAPTGCDLVTGVSVVGAHTSGARARCASSPTTSA